MRTNSPPLVTFAIFSFNQEKYIRQAVEGAFSQKYQPLEIIISDDASSDSTPEIILNLASQYRGPHKVLVNLNESNLGIGEHVNKIFDLASGELLVFAAGDDISTPERVEITTKLWTEKKFLPSMIYCGANIIDFEGKHAGRLDTALPGMDRKPEELIEYSHSTKLLLMGACASYAKSLICNFGPLRKDLTVEDIPLAVRSSLLGGIECIDLPLVQYRKNVSVWLPRKLPGEKFDRHFSRMSHRAISNHTISEQILSDSIKSGNIEAISTATNRHLSTDFTLSTLQKRKFSAVGYFSVSIKSGHWRGSIFPAILFGFPRIHRLIFLMMWMLRKSR